MGAFLQSSIDIERGATDNYTMTASSCLNYFTECSGEMLRVLEGLLALDSPSADAGAVGAFACRYAELLDAAGVPSSRIPGPHGPHIFGELVPPHEHGSPIVLVGHADTVWPLGEASRRPPRRSDGKLFGPGALDMRGGLLIALFALRFLRNSGRSLGRRVQVFISADEELGSTTAHPHMARLLAPQSTALILEPPLEDGSLKLSRKGVGMYRVHVRGREAHAGLEPERGVSAVAELARRIVEVLSWAEPARGITLNVGEVHGGIATNVVPGEAWAGLDVRFDRLEDGEEVHRRLRDLSQDDPRAELSVSGGIIFPPLVPDARGRRLADIAIGLARELGLEISAGKSGGGSDGSFLASRGLAVLDGLGADGGGAHSREEHVIIERLPVRAALLARLILALDG